MAQQPSNILLIHSDQHRYDCLGLHGHPRLQTPHLDRLAAQGTDFSHAFTPSPICSPARASLMTGRWPSQHRCVNIPPFEGYQPARVESPVVWQLLRGAGFRQAHFGKYHGELPGLPTDYGVDRYAWEEDDYDDWREQRGLEPRVRRNGWFGEVDPRTRVQDSRLVWGADLASRAIEDFSAEGRPFFVRWDPSEPHLPCMIPREIADLYPPESLEPWPSFADPLENKPPMQRQQQRAWGVEGWSWEQWAPVVSRYLAEITLLDRCVGQLLQILEDRGLRESTLVIYSTDHGDLCGGHGMMDKHYMMYDDVLRVPLIMSQPGTVPAGQTCDAMVIHELDLAATLVGAAGLEVPETFAGRDLRPVLRGDQTLDRPDVFSQYFGCQFGLYSSRMVRDRRWKYVWNATAPDELYDLQQDPVEFVNRIDDPAAQGELTRLRQRMIHWCQSTGDRLLNEFTRWQLEATPPAPARPDADSDADGENDGHGNLEARGETAAPRPDHVAAVPAAPVRAVADADNPPPPRSPASAPRSLAM